MQGIILGQFVRFAFLLLFITNSCQKVEKGVTFWHVLGGPIGEVLDQIIEEFNTSSPGDKLMGVKMGYYSTLSQKLMGAVSSGTPPTMAQVYESWSEEFLEVGKLEPFNNYLQGEQFDSLLEDIFLVFERDNQWGGEYLTFPFNKSVPVFFYNMDLFKKHGITEFPQTWEEFRQVIKKLTVDSDQDGEPEIYGAALPIDVWLFATILYQKGGRLLKDTVVTFATREGIEALEFLVSLIHQDHSAYLATGFKHQDDFLATRAAITFGSIVSYGFLKDRVNFKLGIAPIPHDQDSVVLIAGTNVALFKDTREEARKRAVEFIKFFLSDSVQLRWVQGTGYLPLRKSIMQHKEMQEFFKKVPGIKEAMLQVEYADFEPRSSVWLVGRKYLLTEGLEPALRGYLSPQEALLRAKNRVELELARHKKED